MKVYRGVELKLHTFLTSALDVGDWSASRPGRFIPRERAPCTHWIGDKVGPGADLNAVVKNSQPFLGIEPPIFELVAQCYATEL
jgi:hypothetical protein